MTYTNVIVKTGKDLANFFYSVPENVQPFKTEGEAVSRIEISVYVDGMMFFSEEFRFTGAATVKPFGKIDILNLGEGEYTYRVRETIISMTNGSFDKTVIGHNDSTGSFFISEAPAQGIISGKVCSKTSIADF